MRKALFVSGVISMAITMMSFSFGYHPPKKDKIVWLSLSELQTAYKMQRRPILIDVYTSWCGWCKVMDKETYTNPKVIEYINKNYYAVKFNAEATDTVTLNGKKYGFNPQYNVNDLAVFLLGGRMGYPTTVLLSSLSAQPAPIAGYLNPQQIEAPLKYFGDGSYKKLEYNDFMKGFAGTW